MTTGRDPDAPSPGTHLLVRGRVQGVGFRYFVKQVADAAGIAGWVRNLHDGRVEAVLIGSDAALQPVLDRIGRGPLPARVEEVLQRPATADECRSAVRPFTLRGTA